MALSTASMKSDVLNAMKGVSDDTADKANKRFGDAILKNICNNIDITYSWSAVNIVQPYNNDPTTSFKATVSGSGTLTPSANFNAMLIKLAALIKGLKISSPVSFILTPSLSFNSAAVLSITMNKENKQDSAIEAFCNQLIISVKNSFKNPVPSAGKHEATDGMIYNGATTSMVIA